MSRKSRVVLWILSAGIVLIRLTMVLSYMFVLVLIADGTALVLLRKCGLPSGRYRGLSVLFAAVSVISYLGYQRDPSILVFGLFAAGIPTLLSSLAVFSVMERCGGFGLTAGGGATTARSIGIGIASGAVLSAVNILISEEEVRFGFSFWKILLSLNPAVFEEMACRAVFMAYCVFFSNGGRMSRRDVFTMYFMMAVPHTVVHGYGLGDTVVLCVLFALPFSLLQRKVGIGSAMISHGLVDAVRFVLIMN